ncbi:MAG: T9SS type A sorting domain-containing protein, partial [Bacteroidetes bacterium]|nr:T9SS type A sorting domain-containing protein [Bacteroidota bacterium]
PVTDYLNIISKTKIQNPLELSIYSSSGKLISNHEMCYETNKIDTRQLCRGTYFLSIVKDGKLSVFKFVKQ